MNLSGEILRSAQNDKTTQNDGYISQLDKLLTEPYRLIRAEYDEKAVADIFPEAGAVVSPQFSLSGVLKKKNATVKLYFGHGNTVEESVSVALSAMSETESCRLKVTKNCVPNTIKSSRDKEIQS